jgi:hypothetical protein
MKRIACCVGARTLAAILECLPDLWRVLIVPVCRIAEFPIMLGVRLRQRRRPTPVCDVISIEQRLKSGAELDSVRRQNSPGPRLVQAVADQRQLQRRRLLRQPLGRGSRVAKNWVWLQTCLWVACYARGQPDPFGLTSSWFGLEPGRKLVLPLGLQF